MGILCFTPTGTGGPGGVSFCRLTGSDGTNNAGSTNNGGRVNTYNFMPDLLGCASGPRMGKSRPRKFDNITMSFRDI